MALTQDQRIARDIEIAKIDLTSQESQKILAAKIKGGMAQHNAVALWGQIQFLLRLGDAGREDAFCVMLWAERYMATRAEPSEEEKKGHAIATAAWVDILKDLQQHEKAYVYAAKMDKAKGKRGGRPMEGIPEDAKKKKEAKDREKGKAAKKATPEPPEPPMMDMPEQAAADSQEITFPDFGDFTY